MGEHGCYMGKGSGIGTGKVARLAFMLSFGFSGGPIAGPGLNGRVLGAGRRMGLSGFIGRGQ
jgi:hypothetical protein